MNSFRSQVIGKGRITIPKAVREKLGIQDGDFVEIEIKKKLILKEAPNG